ncbi:helix-turn-helix domain-containing protein [Streptococcus hyointestinalis]|uniref:helix-turn-helix domain-containing protein n=1 Tax=Streptococcus hyointestinalis TaxID=1337 RepID=UPI0013DF88A5|nr:helix-turn-helix transcriptional regulator [Streptococcus hyointestinalis]
MILTTLGRNLRRIRKANKETLKAVAEATGISYPTLSSIETGKSDVRVTTLAKLVNYYGCSYADVFREW